MVYARTVIPTALAEDVAKATMKDVEVEAGEEVEVDGVHVTTDIHVAIKGRKKSFVTYQSLTKFRLPSATILSKRTNHGAHLPATRNGTTKRQEKQ